MSNKNYVKDTNYLQIQGWMVSKLRLKGNSLLIYAIIYGFSQDGHNMFKGTMNYLAQWTCSSKESVRQILNKLCDSELIIKQVEYINNVKFVYYRTNLEKVGGYTTLLTNPSNKVVEGIQESWVNNNITNSINDKVEEDKLPQATVNTNDTSKTITENILPPIGYYSNEDITEQKYKELKDLTVEELERLKQIVIENRDSKLLTYREIQKMFDLVDKVTYDTPTECNKLISRKRKGSIRLNKPQERCTGFGEEIF